MTALSPLFILTGVIALAQVTFLPGWLMTRLLKADGPLAWRLVVGFGLGLMANYWLLFILTACGIYTVQALLVIVVLEAAALSYSYRESLTRAHRASSQEAAGAFIRALKSGSTRFHARLSAEFSPDADGSFKLVACALAGLTLCYLAYLLASNVGSIFNLWDPIVSWNRWAVEWSMNAFPTNTWEYPQLVPLNWSIFYVLVGAPLEYLPKLIMPLFPIGIAVSFACLGIRKRSWAFIAAIPATILLMRVLNGSEILATEGYVDTAVAFFSTVSVLCLFWPDEQSPRSELVGSLVVGGLFAIGAAMTKQAGLFTVAIFPILAWLVVLKNVRVDVKKSWLKYLLCYVGALVVLIGPFYIYKEVSIASHSDTSVIPTITGIVYGSGKGAVAVAAGALWYLVKKTYGLIFIYLALLVVACRSRKYRWVILVAAIPYALIWSLFFSYDTRNLSLAMPLIGLGAGAGIDLLFMDGKNRFADFVAKIRPIYWVALVILALAVASPLASRKIAASHVQDKRSMYDPELSLLLSNYFDQHPDGQIFTDFPIAYFLPATSDQIFSPYGGFSPNVDDFREYFKYASTSKVDYILAAGYADKAVLSDIEQNIANGTYTLIFRKQGFVLVKTNN